MHISRSYHSKSFVDWNLLSIVISICSIGLWNLYSASQTSGISTFQKQIVFIILGIIIAIMVSQISMKTFESAAYPLYLVCVGLLILVLAIGPVIKGSQRWLPLPGDLNLQPSEIMKVAIILAVGKYFSRTKHLEELTLGYLVRFLNISRPIGFFIITGWYWSHLSSGMKIFLILLGIIYLGFSLSYYIQLRSIQKEDIIAPIDVILLPSLLVLIEPDLGTAMILLLIAFSILFFIGFAWVSYLWIGLSCIGTFFVAWTWILKPYQKQRILTFLNPENDLLGAGYHATQSLIAVGSGLLSGKGFTSGTQSQLRFLPEQTTDFIFSVFAEEHGFIGALILITLYFLLFIYIAQIITKAKNRFAILITVGASMFIFWHVFVNISMVIGLLPVVGVPLPFFSYGGSSMLTTMISLGIIMSVSNSERNFGS